MMSILLGGRRALRVAALVMFVAAPASAQLRSSVALSGLSNPVAFVQDPSNAAVQYVVQLGGVIRVVQNGTLLATPLANLSHPDIDRRRTRPARPRVPAELRLLGTLLRLLHQSLGAHRRLAAAQVVGQPAGVGWIARSICCGRAGTASSRSRSRITTAATSRLVPTATCTSASAMAAAATIPITTRRIRRRCSARCSASTSRFRTATPKATTSRRPIRSSDRAAICRDLEPSGCATRGAGASTIRRSAARARWSLATSGQGAREEIDYEPAGLGGRNYGWRNREGFVETNISRCCRRRSRR